MTQTTFVSPISTFSVGFCIRILRYQDGVSIFGEKSRNGSVVLRGGAVSGRVWSSWIPYIQPPEYLLIPVTTIGHCSIGMVRFVEDYWIVLFMRSYLGPGHYWFNGLGEDMDWVQSRIVHERIGTLWLQDCVREAPVRALCFSAAFRMYTRG